MSRIGRLLKYVIVYIVGSMVTSVVTFLGVIATSVVLTPLLYALGGYLFGWLLVNLFWFAGEWFISGASYLGLEIPLDALPVIFCFLALVGSFFRSMHTYPSKK